MVLAPKDIAKLAEAAERIARDHKTLDNLLLRAGLTPPPRGSPMLARAQAALLGATTEVGIDLVVALEEKRGSPHDGLRKALTFAGRLPEPAVPVEDGQDDSLVDYIFGSPDEEAESDPMIFISHSSENADYVELLIEFIEGYFHVGENQIRCTSVPGYKLIGGDHISSALKDYIGRCHLVIGVVSSESAESAYVLIELGAAWGQDKGFVALLLPDSSPSLLPGPIGEHHALKAHEDYADLVDVLKKKTPLSERPTALQKKALNKYESAMKALAKK